MSTALSELLFSGPRRNVTALFWTFFWFILAVLRLGDRGGDVHVSLGSTNNLKMADNSDSGRPNDFNRQNM